jgi:hypothetical protein
MKLSKHLLVAAMAAMLSIVAISSAPVAAQSDQPGHPSMSVEDRGALLDARIVALCMTIGRISDSSAGLAPSTNFEDGSCRWRVRDRIAKRVSVFPAAVRFVMQKGVDAGRSDIRPSSQIGLRRE